MSDDMLFNVDPDWKQHWNGMPDYSQKNLMPWQTVKVHFKSEADRKAFGELMQQTVTEKTVSMWYPKAELVRVADKRYASSENATPRYPVYVPTKGRYDSAYTIRTLEELKIPYFAVIQPHERVQYEKVVKTGTILLLPEGLDGLVPARNWIKEHSKTLHAARHWQIDDNIDGFFRLHENLKIKVSDGSIFRAMEDFSDRYTNIAISGPNYHFFAKRKQLIQPFLWNTRVYSCSLISNLIPHGWRDVYNDDTDICLRAMKDGLCTVQFNAFLSGKKTTMTVKSGNTDIYQGDGRRLMAESLLRQHPDVVKITEKFGHWQHQVDYSSFKRNKPILDPEKPAPSEVDEYAMDLVSAHETEDPDVPESAAEAFDKAQPLEDAATLELF